MHIALQTHDILCEIFTHGRQDESWIDRRTLYHASLVCKHFLPHALNALWYSMDTLKPLTKLIPETLKMEWDDSFSFCGILRKEDLSVFESYASRIQQLKLNDDTCDMSVPAVIDLLECVGRKHVLPNLRRLTMGSESLYSGHLKSFFLCPSLESLELCSDSQQELCEILPNVARAAPSIRHLVCVNHAIPDRMLPLLNQYKKLLSLDTAFNDFTISSSSSIFFAEHLSMLRAASITCLQDASLHFFSLTTLELTQAVPAKKIQILVSRCPFPKLKALTFCGPHYDPATIAASVFKKSLEDLISTVFAQITSLTDLSICRNSDQRGRYDAEVHMDLDDFLPKSKLKTLQKFWIGPIGLLRPIQSSSIEKLCSMLPCLTDLYLDSEVYRPVPSFSDLATLAAKLPLLVTLDISILREELADPPSVPILTHGLQKIRIRKSLIADCFLFARYLDRLFPLAVVAEPREDEDDLRTVVSALKLVRGCRQDQAERSAPISPRRSRRLQRSGT